jgi:hypothetical protein
VVLIFTYTFLNIGIHLDHAVTICLTSNWLRWLVSSDDPLRGHPPERLDPSKNSPLRSGLPVRPSRVRFARRAR